MCDYCFGVVTVRIRLLITALLALGLAQLGTSTSLSQTYLSEMVAER